ncbi:uncharacterized protein ELE39_001230 [Cryptosporidium sp. chipmunk genotype I]|uniref:uncharacterized protein n=1 Tax=Cryptosporidium sp. chipmunk genotype I TaxID=1280935 RepID=UPI003519F49A|nr:hypothetical protein ELE39_001230 [Cryptosporidium sp. chipmunk genotype I]
MNNILILFLTSLVIQYVLAICRDKCEPSLKIAMLNDFSISIEKRIQNADKKQLLSARKYASAQLEMHAYNVFQKLSLGYKENRQVISNKLERYKQRCTELGTFAFCRDLAEYLLSNLSPKPEVYIGELINNIYNNKKLHYLEDKLPCGNNFKEVNTLRSSDNNLIVSVATQRKISKKDIHANIKLYMENDETYKRESLLHQEQIAKYHIFDNCKLLARSELNENTIKLMSNLMTSLIKVSLEKKGLCYSNAPQNFFNATMNSVFDELKDSLIRAINQDPYNSPDSIVLRYVYSYYHFACRHVEAESSKRG